MAEIFGDFNENLPPSQEYLRIQFSPSSIPIKHRWRNNGLSADFMADYLITFFSKSPDKDELPDQQDIKSTISYIANELLENAMKFSESIPEQPISITLHLLDDRLIFLSTNGITPDSKGKLQAFIDKLSVSDPDELYTKQLEESARGDRQDSSGLGILTMMTDYLAKVGWKFETAHTNPEALVVTTMVQLAV